MKYEIVMGDVTCHTGQTLLRVLQTQSGKRHRMRTATVVNQYDILAHNEQWNMESDSVIMHRSTTTTTTTDDDKALAYVEFSADRPTRTIT